jgi:hypothetical protein
MKEFQKKLPVNCPSCNSFLQVKKLCCSSCGTAVEGNFELPFFSNFSPDEQEFIIEFVSSSGSLKKMADHMKKSYPSVRNYLDELIQKINNLKHEQ